MEMLQEYRYKFVQFWRRGLQRASRSRTFRIISSLVAFALTALLIVLPLRAQQPVVLSILIPAPDVKPFPPVIAEFERQNPGIKINIVEGPNASNLVEDLYSSAFLLGDSPYDLLNMDITWVPKFAAAGWLQDISDILPQSELAQFLQGDIEGGKYKGKLYRLPYRTDVGMLYYRSDLLQQAGLKPPETFQDLIQASKTIQGKNAAQWGYVWQGRQYEGLSAGFTEVLQGNGGFWINPQTNEVGLDRPEAIDTVKFLVSTIQQGISPSGVNTYIEEDTRRLFQSGNTLFMRNWPYAWDLLNAKDSPVQGKVGIKPMVRAPNERSGACQGGWGLGISSTTRHSQEARKVVQFMTSPEIQKQLSIAGAYLPTRRELYNDKDLLQRYQYFPLVLKILENPALRPPIAQYAQASDILQRYLNATLSGQLSPEDAMRSAARETRSLLGV